MDQKQLRQYEYQCIQEEAPWCVSSCPLHVDARKFCKQLADGNPSKAWEVLLRYMPVPGILARICDHPCEDACKRQDAGDPIRIGALERQVASTPEPRVKKIPIPSKSRNVLVLGAGLSSLSAAHDLAKKGFGVRVLSGEELPGGTLKDLSADVLPPEAVEHEQERLTKLGVTFEFGADMPSDLAEYPPEGWDAVFIGGDDSTSRPLLEGKTADPKTGALSAPGVFGALEGDAFSPINLASAARRAVVSIDRFLQNVSLSAGREKEGPYETRLYTNIEDVEPKRAVPMSDASGYDASEARAEASRCLQCECLECVKACRYLDKYGAYPKVYVRRIYNNDSIVKGHHQANTFINSCMLCDLCTKVCPEDFPMAEVCLNSRRGMIARDKMPPSAHWFALKDMDFSNSEKAAIARNEPGTEKSGWLFYPGCQLSGSAPESVSACYGHLRGTLKGNVGLALGCCGAPARWAGREETYKETMAAFEVNWREMGEPTIITACTTCLSMFRESLPHAGIVSLWEVFEQYGLPEGSGGAQRTLTVDDPCTSRDMPEVQQCVRGILSKLGVEIREFEKYGGELAKCCGFGGLVFNADADMARTLTDDRAADDDGDYLAYCAMCRDRLAKSGKRAVHLLDLIYPGNADPGERKDPGFSIRQENRYRLRQRLLSDVWKEKPIEMEAFEKIELDISSEVAEMLENRRILVRDVQQVIEYAERTGKRLKHEERGSYLASHKPGAVTFWVEYIPKDGAYEVLNAYSHRMEIKGAAQ